MGSDYSLGLNFSILKYVWTNSTYRGSYPEKPKNIKIYNQIKIIPNKFDI